MASIETVDFYKFKETQVNISGTVGKCEINERNDVMLIQTLFKIIGWSETISNVKFGLEMKDLPEPNGVYDDRTNQAIWGFQKKMANRLRSIDGKIHPASYKNRVLKKGIHAKQMMITLLNFEASNEALMKESLDLLSAIKKISPNIVFA